MTRTFLLSLALGAGTLAAAQSVNAIPATPLSAPTQTAPVQTQTAPERAATYPSGYTTEQLQAAQRALAGLPGLSALELDPTQGRVRVTVGTAVQRVAVLQRLTQAGLPTGVVTFAPNAPGATGTVTETPTPEAPANDRVYPSGYRLSQLQQAQSLLTGLSSLSTVGVSDRGVVEVNFNLSATDRAEVQRRLSAAGLPAGIVTFTAPTTNITTPSVTPTPGGRVSVTELASGTNAAVNTPAVQVASTQAALNALYRVAYGNQTGTPAVPALRSGETVVGVFLGQRPTGGYGVQVTGASVQNGVLTLTVDIRAPGPGAITTQALTSPWTLVRVPGTFTRVQLVNVAGQPVQLGTGTGGGQTR
ncbi:hypothetical protein L1280_002940 [Deinococcus sp. HSC-46F16]|uniref:protease complex subunit PrcB family protein n=1 Tax=Deinococcus sp. HSC-46F16 TaxID=2910968 RepID=UPI00209DB477|nr:protease complex subunit PrcB family protein [Deinococcus sp. HSC-46F16]MCP2015764.1 hypothetical protein [Deinococcus sp. HSC-46F16]